MKIFDFYLQTIQTLNLDYNQIGVQGAENLANVLKSNTVTN